MGALAIVERWDAALRAAEWAEARRLLADDCTFRSPEAEDGTGLICDSADEIVALMAAWKGEVPDVVVVEWAEHGNRVLARLRQPAWGNAADWFQVISIDDGRIVAFTDYQHEASARAAVV